jgi:hypothetical protein
MKRILMLAGLGLAIVGLAVGLTIFGFRQSKERVAPVPSDWRVVNLDDFSFSIPSDMKEMGGEGTDLSVWKYRRSDISIEVHYGPTSAHPQYFLDQPEYIERPINIGGRKGTLATFRLDDSNIGTFSNGSLKYVVAAHLTDNVLSAPVTVWIIYSDKSQQEFVTKVIHSFRFKSKQ